MATLTVPPLLSSPRADAIDLHKAFKGFGCDTLAVVNILAHRDSHSRPLIQQEYQSMYHEELTQRLSSELSGHLKRAVLLWILDPATRDEVILREALTSEDGIDSRAATEIICSRTPSQVQILKQTYHARTTHMVF